MLNVLRAVKKFIISILKDRQFWYTILAEMSLVVSNYFANRKARRARRKK
jgi:hypothetical protein